jgi:hypothetical protein
VLANARCSGKRLEDPSNRLKSDARVDACVAHEEPLSP